MPWLPCCCVPVEECRLITTPGCAEEASIYSITVSGLTNSGCSYCADWNGTFDLKYARATEWESAASSSTNCGHTAGDPLWRLTYTGTEYVLEAVGIGYEWSLAAASWSCLSNNVLSGGPFPVPGACSGAPATITAVPCIMTCEACDDDMPATVSVTFTGFDSSLPDDWFEYCPCEDLDGTYVLPKIRTCIWGKNYELSCNGGRTLQWGISVTIGTFFGDTVIGVTVNGHDAPYARYYFSYVFSKTVTGTPIDCTGTYSMTTLSGSGVALCHVDTGWTCQLN